jgi:hypothetical protein
LDRRFVPTLLPQRLPLSAQARQPLLDLCQPRLQLGQTRDRCVAGCARTDLGQQLARYDKWKAVFQEQRKDGFKVWQEPFVKVRLPLLFNLRSDPFEKAPIESSYYDDWRVRRLFLLVPAQAYVAKWISSFKDFPPRQKPASFSIDEIMKKLEEGSRSR